MAKDDAWDKLEFNMPGADAEQARERMRFWSEAIDEIVTEFYAKRIVMAEMEDAKKRGEFRGGERRQRRARRQS